MEIRLTREVPLWAGSLLSVAAVASLVEVSGILTRLVGLRREWGEGCGERVCCEPPWAQFPRQEGDRAGAGGCRVAVWERSYFPARLDSGMQS